MQSKGDLKGFWEARRRDGSPIATTALGIFAPEDVSPVDRVEGAIVTARLDSALVARDGVSNPFIQSIEMAYIGKDVAGGYISAVDANKGYEPSLRQLNAIHYQVLTRQGLGGSVYGGTPFGYGPTGGWKTWGDLQSVLINKVFDYCDGCSE